MKISKLLGAGVLSMMVSVVGFAGQREDAIRATEKLAEKTADLSEELLTVCGCQNSARLLADMSDKAGDLELTIRYGTRDEAVDELKDIVRVAIKLRKFVNNIQIPSLKLRVKKTYRTLLNEVGFLVDPFWVTVKAAPVVAVGMTDEQLEEVLQDGLVESAVSRTQSLPDYQ